MEKLLLCVSNNDATKKENFEKIVTELRYFLAVVCALEPKVRNLQIPLIKQDKVLKALPQDYYINAL